MALHSKIFVLMLLAVPCPAQTSPASPAPLSTQSTQQVPETPPSADKSLTLHDAGVTPPKVLHSVNPEFPDKKLLPKSMRKPGNHWNVVVELNIDTQGLPQDIHVVQSAGYGFDEQAIAAIQQYRFKSATKDGKPVSVRLTIDVNFAIRNAHWF